FQDLFNRNTVRIHVIQLRRRQGWRMTTRDFAIAANSGLAFAARKSTSLQFCRNTFAITQIRRATLVALIRSRFVRANSMASVLVASSGRPSTRAR
ncbi:MAG: hypothetical protein VCF08_19075, partial [Alphaproteobacteria bacterium]